MKKIFIKNILLALLVIWLLPLAALAQNPKVCSSTEILVTGADGNPECVPNTTNYTLLQPLPCENIPGCTNGELSTYNAGGENPIGTYLNMMIKLLIGLSGVAAMVMIVIGGLEYMTTELVSHKENAKERITNAVFGLILALGSYTLLYTINPDLLNTDVKLRDLSVTVVVKDEPEEGISGKTISLTNKNGGTVSLKACDSAQMVTISLFDRNIEVYKGAAQSLRRIDVKWHALPADKRYQVKSIGGYNCREVTGKPGFTSAHAFGLALDINPEQNPYGNTLKKDMPPEFINLFIEEGWGWGGNWSRVKDPMHFSKYPPSEFGNATVEI